MYALNRPSSSAMRSMRRASLSRRRGFPVALRQTVEASTPAFSAYASSSRIMS